MLVKDIWQCCYAHDNGWRVVFDNIQNEDVKKNCAELLKRNCSVAAEYLEENPDLFVHGVYCDEKAAYVYRIQYGLEEKGVRQRKVSFSHAYVFPWTENIEAQLNFLFLNNDDFKSNLEDVYDIQGNELAFNKFSLSSVFAELNIDIQDYKELIDSVFYKLNSSSEYKPLYIKYNGDILQMFKILYCILLGLPYDLRKKMSAVSYETNNKSDAGLIFTLNLTDGELCVNPVNHEDNNVLNDDQIKEIDNLLYVNEVVYIVEKCFNNNENSEYAMNCYFSKLHEFIKSLYGNIECDENQVNFAFKVMKDRDFDDLMDDFNPIMELINVITKNIKGNDLVDNYIAKLIRYFTDGEMNIPRKLENNLLNQIMNSTCQKLKEAYEEYELKSFIKLDINSQIDKLSEIDKSSFDIYASLLMPNANTRRTLDMFFANKKLNAITWNNLIDTFNDIVGIMSKYYKIPQETYDEIIDEFNGECKEENIGEIIDRCPIEIDSYIYYSEITSIREKWQYTSSVILDKALELYIKDIQKNTNISIYDKYENIIKKLYIMQDEKEDLKELLAKAKKIFWNNMSISKLSPMEEYTKVFVQCPTAERFIDFQYLFKILKEEIRPQIFYRHVFDYFNNSENYKYFSMNRQDKEAYINMLCKYVEDRIDFMQGIIPEFIKISAIIRRESNFDEFNIIQQTLYNKYILRYISVNEQKDIALIFYKFNEDLFSETERKEIMSIIYDRLEKICKNNDSYTAPIIFDLWIVTGLYKNNNMPFEIFDSGYPKILGENQNNALIDSILINKQRIRNSAETYIRDKGNNSKKIKAWLNEYNSFNKEKSKDNKINKNDSINNLYDVAKNNRNQDVELDSKKAEDDYDFLQEYKKYENKDVPTIKTKSNKQGLKIKPNDSTIDDYQNAYVVTDSKKESTNDNKRKDKKRFPWNKRRE